MDIVTMLKKLKSNMKRVISVDIPLLWKSLVQVVHNGAGVFTDTARSPGVFMMVVPAETVEDTLNELLQFVWKEILLLIMAIAILRTLADGQTGYLNLGCRILTAVLVVVFTVWSRGYCLMVGGANFAVSVCSPIFRALAPGIGVFSKNRSFQL